MNSKIRYAVAAVLGSASFAGSATASAADATDNSATASTDTIAEITVTAQRRTENMQNVPISMQAFTAQSLQQLNIETFDDYIKYSAQCQLGEQWPRAERGVHARPERGFAGEPGQRVYRLVAQRRDLPRQPVGSATQSQPRYLCR